MLEAAGYRVAILSQPDYKSCDAFREYGRPRLGFLVTSGNIDSMVAHYTASKKRRSFDYYSPGGEMGKRPDRAVIVYSNRIREAYGDVPIIIGGLEASLRRFAHYDYWDNKVRRSVLVDSTADILTYGMGENILLRLAELLSRGVPIKKIRDVRGTVYLCKPEDAVHYEVAATFGSASQLVGSFLLWSGGIAALCGFILSFLLDQALVYYGTIGIMALVLVIRTIVFVAKQNPAEND